MASSYYKMTLQVQSSSRQASCLYTDSGSLNWHLGIKYKRDKGNRTIDTSQTQYIEDLLTKNIMTE